jgi:hypothetical protein
VLEYNGTTGAFVGAFVTAGSGGLSRPIGLVFGPAIVPEPSAFHLFGIGTLGLIECAWRRRK